MLLLSIKVDLNRYINDIDNAIAIISDYISDLTEAANIYSTAENAAKTAAEGLPVDGVFKV